ncbi:MAG: acetyl-CoA carboxylase biotin carboxyl carrier protein [Hyphomonadaceae bacterium]|nr:MAG: acetyl-CoA carboxylase biotin carboxyl carrier protein [Hyphomonadaceae bacterium]KAF0186298.1 MAG: acetyl-CoA carboxylase biotin carboxyl carrier protein [Hyphomonadaceae bacterium]
MTTNGFDTKLVKELAKILRDSDLSEIEVDHAGTKIRVAKQSNVISQIAAPQTVQHSITAPIAAPIAMPSDPAQIPPIKNEVAANFVTSPMVGTIYLAQEPGATPFVNIGDTVSEGQQLFVVEAMKTLNAVNAHCGGVIKAILVKDAQPVEFGERLCIIE